MCELAFTALLLLTRGQAHAFEELFAQLATDPALKAELALLLGSLKPDARQTGERLLQYQPTQPAASAPAQSCSVPGLWPSHEVEDPTGWPQALLSSC